jgi:hypothetical protein
VKYIFDKFVNKETILPRVDSYINIIYLFFYDSIGYLDWEISCISSVHLNVHFPNRFIFPQEIFYIKEEIKSSI